MDQCGGANSNLESLPTEVRILVRERKPKIVAQAVDDYVHARGQEENVPGASIGSPRQCREDWPLNRGVLSSEEERRNGKQ